MTYINEVLTPEILTLYQYKFNRHFIIIKHTIQALLLRKHIVLRLPDCIIYQLVIYHAENPVFLCICIFIRVARYFTVPAGRSSDVCKTYPCQSAFNQDLNFRSLPACSVFEMQKKYCLKFFKSLITVLVKRYSPLVSRVIPAMILSQRNPAAAADSSCVL